VVVLDGFGAFFVASKGRKSYSLAIQEPRMADAIIVQVNISSGGIPKRPVQKAWVGELGLSGDDHDDKRLHGGPERAVCLFALERIEAMAAEGDPIGAGSAGENITTRGLEWAKVVPGAQLRLGADVVVEITGYAPPCKKNQAWFKGGDFNRINQKLFPGWSRVYAKVLATGTVRPGDRVELLSPSGDGR
jgi:MOSC domain-containing protein YiiM